MNGQNKDIEKGIRIKNLRERDPEDDDDREQDG
jgi:hypothetical protein